MRERQEKFREEKWAGGLIALFLLLLLASACVPSPAPAPTPTTPAPAPVAPAPAPAVAATPAWEIEWEKTLEAAKKEGRLAVYTTLGGEIRQALMVTFKKTYGIPVEFVAISPGAALGEKILSERRAGLYFADLYLGGAGTGINVLKAAKALDPLEPLLLLPEVTNPKLWWEERLWWVDGEHSLLAYLGYVNWPFAINTELVKPDEIKTFRDVLNPKWKGKMVLSDSVFTGTGRFYFGAVGMQMMGMDYMREIAKQEPAITRDWRQQAEWVARGKYAIALAPYPAAVLEFVKAGAPIKLLTPQEGSYLTSGHGKVATFNKAPHPNAAKVFVDWLLSKEGQILYSRVYFRQSLRLDVPTDALDPESLRQPGVKYASTLGEDYILQEPKNNELAREIFGHLMK